MELFEAIAWRYSYRGAFTDDAVPREDLEKIVAAGAQAPSGCNAETTTFLVIDDPDVIAAVREHVYRDRPFMKTAQALIACVCDTKPVYSETTFYKEDAAAAVQNMLLAITALDYATVWIQGGIMGSGGEAIAKLLGIPNDKELLILLPIGTPVEPGPRREKKPLQQRLLYNGWK